MPGNLPVAFAALLAGGLLIDKGAAATKQAFGGSSSSPSSSSTAIATTPAVGTASASGAKAIRNYLTAGGLTKVAAAGVVGNLQQESGLRSDAPGGGLAQWIGSRWTALVAFAGRLGLAPSSEQAQLDYLLAELRTSYPLTLQQLNAASTPAEAAVIFQNQYERPSVPMQANRIAYANAAYQL